jgi:hypothetical protein
MALPAWRINTQHYPPGTPGKKGGQFAPKTGAGGGVEKKPMPAGRFWKVTAPDGTDPELKPMVDGKLQQLAARYTVRPELSMEPWDKHSTVAVTPRGTNEIILNEDHWGLGNADDLKADRAMQDTMEKQAYGFDFKTNKEAVTYAPWANYTSPEDDITHEYAHVLTNRLARDDPAAALRMIKAVRDLQGMSTPVTAPEDEYQLALQRRKSFIQKYGAYTLTDPREGIANLFVAYEHGDTSALPSLVGQGFMRYRTVESKRERQGNPHHDPHTGQFTHGPGGAKTGPVKKTWSASVPAGVDPSMKPMLAETADRLASKYTVPMDYKLAYYGSDVLAQVAYGGELTHTIQLPREVWATGNTYNLTTELTHEKRGDYVRPLGVKNAAVHGTWSKLVTPGELITHEYGHVIDNQLKRDDPEAHRALVQAMRELYGISPTGDVDVQKVQAYVDTYGMYGLTDPKEAIGEGFGLYERGDRSPLAMLVGKAFQRYEVKPAKREQRINIHHRPAGKGGGQFTSGPKGGGQVAPKLDTAALQTPSAGELTTLEDKARNGGFTYSTVSHKSPSRGYAFSPYPKRSKVIDTKAMTPAVMRQYINDNQDLLSKRGHFLGAWREQAEGVDRIWLDVSVVAPTKTQATQLGRKYNQIAAWDLAGGKEVPLGGTGRTARWGQAHPVHRAHYWPRR